MKPNTIIMDEHSELRELRAQITRLTDELDSLKSANGDLGERLGVSIQRERRLVDALESVLQTRLEIAKANASGNTRAQFEAVKAYNNAVDNAHAALAQTKAAQ